MKRSRPLLAALILLACLPIGCSPKRPANSFSGYADVCAAGCSDTLRERMRCVRVLNSYANRRDAAGDHKTAQYMHGVESVIMQDE